MIRGIIFDCFGVLYQGSIAHLYELISESQRAELDNLSLSSDYGYISHEEYIAQVAQLAGKTFAEIESIVQANHIRNQAMVDCVRTLRPAYKVALLSNVGRGVIDRLFTSSELTELFDVVVLSSEVGMIKPDGDIYRFTAERLEVAESECVMIDDLAVNIEGAKSVGMQGIVYQSASQVQADMAALIGNVVEL